MIEIDDDEFRAAQADALAEAEELPPSPFEADAVLLAQTEAEADDLDEWRQEEFMRAVNTWAAGANGEGPVEIPYDLWSRGSDAAVDAYLVARYRKAHPMPAPPKGPQRATPMPPVAKTAPKPVANPQRLKPGDEIDGWVVPLLPKNQPTGFRRPADFGPPVVPARLPRIDDPDGWRSR